MVQSKQMLTTLRFPCCKPPSPALWPRCRCCRAAAGVWQSRGGEQASSPALSSFWGAGRGAGVARLDVCDAPGRVSLQSHSKTSPQGSALGVSSRGTRPSEAAPQSRRHLPGQRSSSRPASLVARGEGSASAGDRAAAGMPGRDGKGEGEQDPAVFST